MLRPYQERLVDGIRCSLKRGNKRIIVQLPTGGGKTIVFSYMCQRLTKNRKKTLILTDRIELLQQSGGALNSFGLDPFVIHGLVNLKELKKVKLCIAMEQTLTYRLRISAYLDLLKSFDYVIIDEAHKSCFDKYFKYFKPEVVVLGFTATPIRANKQKSLRVNYTSIVHGILTRKLIKQNYLSSPTTFVSPIDLKGLMKKGADYDGLEMDKRFSIPKYAKGVVKNYQKIAPNTKALVFCPGVKSSKELVKSFNDAGIKAMHLDGSMSKTEREAILEGYGTLFNVLCNCDVLTTGFDCPDIETIILYRATKSLVLFMQMVGRGSRTTEIKNTFKILDFGSNVLEHGLWETDRWFTLDKPSKRKPIQKDMEPYRTCHKCTMFLPAKILKCPNCGAEKPLTLRERIEVDLKELSGVQLKLRLNQMDFQELEIVADIKGYHKNWVSRFIYQRGGLAELKEFGQKKNYRNGWMLKQGYRK